MKKILLLLLLSISCYGYDFKITVSWDEMEGDIEGLIQYFHSGETELIRGNMDKPSSDNNVKVERTFGGGSQIFYIENTNNKQFNIWLVNPFGDDSFAMEEDYYVLSQSGATVTIESGKTNSKTTITIPAEEPGLAYFAANIVDNTPLKQNEMFSRLRLLKLHINNALNGQNLANADVEIIKKSGEPIMKGTCDSRGRFEFQVEDYGEYKIILRKKDYISSSATFSIGLDELPVSLFMSMSPRVKLFRIVLTWGVNPYDLDAHLAGPIPDGGNFHIWWQNKTLIGGKNFLDRDDTNSYGPETLTIYKPASGTYHYAVHNWTNKNNSNSQALSFSNAKVDVYHDNALLKSFKITPGQKGTAWHVFDINEQQKLVPINKYSTISDSKLVISY